jgi:hypothetical protein
MVRLKAVRERTGDRILPAIYSDGYVALMPGESRVLTTELRDADTRGEKPRLVAPETSIPSFSIQSRLAAGTALPSAFSRLVIAAVRHMVIFSPMCFFRTQHNRASHAPAE